MQTTAIAATLKPNQPGIPSNHGTRLSPCRSTFRVRHATTRVEPTISTSRRSDRSGHSGSLDALKAMTVVRPKPSESTPNASHRMPFCGGSKGDARFSRTSSDPVTARLPASPADASGADARPQDPQTRRRSTGRRPNRSARPQTRHQASRRTGRARSPKPRESVPRRHLRTSAGNRQARPRGRQIAAVRGSDSIGPGGRRWKTRRRRQPGQARADASLSGTSLSSPPTRPYREA